MTTVDEALLGRTPLGADLKAGTDAISYDQSIVFTKYVRLILPLDGFVFWVRADLVSASALLNASALNAAALNQPQGLARDAAYATVQGSFHYATERRQEEASTYAVNQVVFTAEQEIDFLNEVGPTVLWVGDFDGLRFSFSSRAKFYRQAKLYHYVGHAVYSDMASQLVDAVEGFDAKNLVVSNSLPAWLALNDFAPGWPFYPDYQPAPLYPSFLSLPNLTPPWGTVHIGEGDTRSLVGAPYLGRRSSQFQLAVDKVRLTLWGCRNDAAEDLLQRVLQYSYDTNVFGIMNMPIVRDDKRWQPELAALAQKKILDFEISYHQRRMQDVARQLILSAVPTYLPRGSLAA